MKRNNSFIKKILFKVLAFENYLYVLSKLYFFSYNIGRLKKSPSYNYHYFVKNLVKAGDTIVDIGANLGYYTCNFSKWVGKNGKVFSYEPVAPVMNVLKKNTKGMTNVILKPFALGEENKEIVLGNMTKSETGYIASGSHFIVDKNQSNNQAMETFSANMINAEKELKSIGKIDFIKCDVEGYELKILSLITEILIKANPILLVETHGVNRNKVIAIMEQINFSPFILQNDTLVHYAIANDTFTDILFFPESKIMEANIYT